MKHVIRGFIILLAVLLCAMPLVACDKAPDVAAGEPTDIPDDDFEDKRIAKFTSTDGKYYVTFNQLTAPEGDLVGVSLCYCKTDGTLIDSVEFYYNTGGRDCNTEDLRSVLWGSNGTAKATMDDQTTIFEFKDTTK
jgi:hypothetical protein